MLENFKTKEFFDNETYKLLGDNAMRLLDIRLKMTIDSIRKVLGIQMFINNGKDLQERCYRTLASKEGSVTGAHYKGMAVDFDLKGLTANEARKLIYKNIDKFPYIRGIEIGINWVHIDIMDYNDSDKRNGVNDKMIILFDKENDSKLISREELKKLA